MELASLILSAAAFVLLLVLLLRKPDKSASAELKATVSQELSRVSADISTSVRGLGDSSLTAVSALGQALQSSQSAADEKRAAQTAAFENAVTAKIDAQNELFKLMSGSVGERMAQMNADIQSFEKSNGARLDKMNAAINDGMAQMREETGKKLNEIRGTVDEKLQTTLEKRISESFRTVSEQLEQVYKGLGEMQNLASDVGGLKKVLSGVKTRGILGEIQLGAILEEILSPEQYDTNIATIPKSSERVEFAVKLPAKDGTVYLPIDSKFPGERYAQLVDAQESGDKERVEAAYKALETVIKLEAKDIRTKYVEVPYTTNFGIMFLPFEGLYAEVVNRGLVEVLQREYQINIAGPSTMAALLNSLQMGFKTLAIQKRSNEVWELLGAVKTEFDKFEEVMLKMQTHLNQTSGDLEALMGVRSRAIQRKLRAVQQLDEQSAAALLELQE